MEFLRDRFLSTTCVKLVFLFIIVEK
jgi:hypothetical protein